MTQGPETQGNAPSETDIECCKVGRTASAFGIDDRLSELSALRRNGASFRDITTTFNTWVVERALTRGDIGNDRSIHAALVGENTAERVYHVLRSDDDSGVQRTELRARLSSTDIDVDRLEASFVSHVTMRSHLQACVGVDPETTPPEFEKTVNTTQRAKIRAKNVIESTLERAAEHEQIEVGSPRTEVVVKITCDECGDMFYLTELLDQQRCSCHTKE